jgi:hypothetical protein
MIGTMGYEEAPNISAETMYLPRTFVNVREFSRGRAWLAKHRDSTH